METFIFQDSHIAIAYYSSKQGYAQTTNSLCGLATSSNVFVKTIINYCKNLQLWSLR
jgi:hypothetical protein